VGHFLQEILRIAVILVTINSYLLFYASDVHGLINLSHKLNVTFCNRRFIKLDFKGFNYDKYVLKCVETSFPLFQRLANGPKRKLFVFQLLIMSFCFSALFHVNANLIAELVDFIQFAARFNVVDVDVFCTSSQVRTVLKL